MPLKTTLTTKSWGQKSFAANREESAPKVLNGHWTAMSHTVMLLWRSYWLHLNKSGIRRHMCLSLNHLLQRLSINSVVWCWSKMKPTVHQFNHMDPDQHLSHLVFSLGFWCFNKLLCLDFKNRCHSAPLLKPANCPGLQGPDDTLLSPLRILPARIARPSTLPCQKRFRGRHLGEMKHSWAR